jgi:hypothetical protein
MTEVGAWLVSAGPWLGYRGATLTRTQPNRQISRRDSVGETGPMLDTVPSWTVS